jgi:hypothetical protein
VIVGLGAEVNRSPPHLADFNSLGAGLRTSILARGAWTWRRWPEHTRSATRTHAGLGELLPHCYLGAGPGARSAHARLGFVQSGRPDLNRAAADPQAGCVATSVATSRASITSIPSRFVDVLDDMDA